MTSSATSTSAAPAVSPVGCPRGAATGGTPCRSTGGGNCAEVVTHRARHDRVAGFTAEQSDAAVALVREVGLNRFGLAERFTEFEAAAPMASKPAKAPTPKGVPLTEKQAEEIERAAANDGRIEEVNGITAAEVVVRYPKGADQG